MNEGQTDDLLAATEKQEYARLARHILTHTSKKLIPETHTNIQIFMLKDVFSNVSGANLFVVASAVIMVLTGKKQHFKDNKRSSKESVPQKSQNATQL